jgi:hypothetical protein
MLKWFKTLLREKIEPMLVAQFLHGSPSGDAQNTCLTILMVHWLILCDSIHFYSIPTEDSDSASPKRWRVAVHDAFIVKYRQDPKCATSQRHLPLHADQSTHSLTIALNPLGDYEGGGTYFVPFDAAIKAGEYNFFCGCVPSSRNDLN